MYIGFHTQISNFSVLPPLKPYVPIHVKPCRHGLYFQCFCSLWPDCTRLWALCCAEFHMPAKHSKDGLYAYEHCFPHNLSLTTHKALRYRRIYNQAIVFQNSEFLIFCPHILQILIFFQPQYSFWDRRARLKYPLQHWRL